MDFVFDVETTGLPKVTSSYINSHERYKDLKGFDNARLLSISWILVHNECPIEQAYFIVKPDDFNIGIDSIKIHGITMDTAMKEGISRQEIFNKMFIALNKCKTLVAHNIRFDVSIIASELYRYNNIEGLNTFLSKQQICTMHKGKEVMGAKKYPKLSELFKYLYNEDIINAHNAQYDTLYCYKCFSKMFPKDKDTFYFGVDKVILTHEQREIVYQDINKNIIVTACAGSGKSSTMLCRVKYLLENKINEESIIMTTFTRDAARDMQEKLCNILGYSSKIKVGTLDSIACSIVTNTSNKKRQFEHVSEYSPLFLEYLKKCGSSFFQRYAYLFVDEFQDINDIQYEIIHTFYKNGVRIFAVGDESQNIYSFRGSNISYIQNFKNLFNNTISCKLTQNFRCSPAIVEFANAILPKTRMSPRLSRLNEVCKKPRIRYFSCYSEQALFITRKVIQYIKNGYKEHDIVILSPNNYALYSIEAELLKHNIKNNILDSNNGENRYILKPEHICLSTIHKSKGLEWKCVFIVEVSDYSFPKVKSSGVDIDESRRLFYIACTRAKERLYLLYTANEKEPYVSRFIQGIDKKLYVFEDFDNKYMNGISNYKKKSSKNVEYIETIGFSEIVFPVGMKIIEFKETFIEDNTLSFEKRIIDNGHIFEYPDIIKYYQLYNEYNQCIFFICLRELAHTFIYDSILHVLPNIFSSLDIEDSLLKYRNINIKNSECIVDIWNIIKHISICKKRKRILYADIPDITHIFPNQIYTNICSFITILNDNEIIPNEIHIKHEIVGDMYILNIGKSLIYITSSSNDDIRLEQIFQTLQCYVTKFKETNIEHGYIFNPIKGWYYIIDLTKWTNFKKFQSWILRYCCVDVS